MTGWATTDTELKAWASGVAEYLTKPFSADGLLKVLEEASRMTEEDRLRRAMQRVSRLMDALDPRGGNGLS